MARKARVTVAAAAVPKVYSYRRFSSKRQSKGDSEARQNETSFNVAKELAAKRGMPFDTELFQGIEALSAYTAKHIEKGSFGRFLAAIEAGYVARGSVLVVDGIDRISRMKLLDGLQVVLTKIIAKGIAIYTGGMEYNADNIQHTIYTLIAMIDVSHQASEQKSQRLKATWIRKRQANEQPAERSRNRFTKWVPAWLGIKVRGSDELIAPDSPAWRHAKRKEFDFEPLPGAVKAIESIFELRLKGMSPASIADVLNKTSRWKPAKHPAKRNATQPFTEAYVRTILFNPAVIGYFQPHTRENGKRVPVGEPLDYYPEIVDPKLFYSVQRKRQTPITSGPTSHIRNLFRGFAFCPYCGNSCYTVHKGEGRPTYHYCYGTRASREETEDGVKRRGATCQAPLFRTDEIEDLLLDSCPRIDPESILSNPSDLSLQRMKLQSELEEVQADIDTRNAKLEINFKRLDDPKFAAYHEKYLKEGDEFRVLNSMAERRLVELRADLERLGADSKSVKNWQEGLVELKKAINQKDMAKRVDLRLRLNSHLRELIARVEIFSRGKFDSQTCYPAKVTAWQELAARHVESTRRDAPATPQRKERWIKEQIAKLPKLSRAKLKAETDRIKAEAESRQFTRTSAAASFAAAAANEGDGIVQHFAGLLPRDAEAKAFLKDLGKRRFGRDGRFLRVWFVTGHKIDLVPEGSIADGLRTCEVEEDGQTVQKLASVSPSLEHLQGRWKRRLARQKV